MIRLNKKLMMFESFNDSRAASTETAQAQAPEATPTSTSDVASTSKDISTDIDAIIANLNDLVDNLESDDSTNESEDLNESVVSTVLAADLSAIPMLALGGTIAAAGGMFFLLKKFLKKKKLKKMYAPAEKSRITAAKIDKALSEISLYDIEKEKRDAMKSKISAYEKKKEDLIKDAEEVESTLDEAFPDEGEQKILSILKAETRVKVAKIKLKGKLSEKDAEELENSVKKYQEMLSREEQEAKEKEAEADEALKNIPKEEQIKNAEENKSKLKKDLEGAEDEEKETIQDQIEGLDTRIANLKGEDAPKEEPKEEPNEEPDTVAKLESDIKAYNDNIETERKELKKLEADLEQAKRDKSTGKGSDDAIQKIEKGIEDRKEDIAELKKKEADAKKKLQSMNA